MRKNNFDGLSAGKFLYPRFFLLFSPFTGPALPAAPEITLSTTSSASAPSGRRSAAEGESAV